MARTMRRGIRSLSCGVRIWGWVSVWVMVTLSFGGDGRLSLQRDRGDLRGAEMRLGGLGETLRDFRGVRNAAQRGLRAAHMPRAHMRPADKIAQPCVAQQVQCDGPGAVAAGVQVGARDL